MERMTWAERFAAMSHEDRVMTIVEDGSTLDALLDECRAAPPPAVDPPALVALVREWQEADRAYNTEAVMRGGSVLTATHERFMRTKRRLLAWTPDAAAPPVAAPAVEGETEPLFDDYSLEDAHMLAEEAADAPPLASGSAPAARPAIKVGQVTINGDDYEKLTDIVLDEDGHMRRHLPRAVRGEG